ncbi:MAG: ribonuclease R family protein [Planctomycetota bacterium]
MPLHHRIRLLDHLTHASYKPSAVEQIMEEMRVDAEDAAEFRETVDALLAEGRLEADFTGKLMLASMPDEIVGRIKVNPRGFGFVIPEEPYREGDVFVPPFGIADAVSGDLVRCEVRRKPPRGGRGPGGRGPGGGPDIVGRVVEVLERGRSLFTGVLVRYEGDWVVEPDGRVISTPIVIRDPHAKNAREGDKVVVELTEYPEDGYNAEGVITRVLGEAGRPDVETQATIEGYGLRDEFPEACNDEARAAARRFEAELAGQASDEGIGAADREDLRETFIFTIDPQDSKDFDDAISIEFDERKREWVLGVHIADVAHFVRPGTTLDSEARDRGNSVYLPRLVLPMLPEILSNGICSLQEGVPRYAKSVFVRFDSRGRVTGQRFAATIISSAKRCTYEEAQALIDGDEAEARRQAKTQTPYTDTLRRALTMADTLARTLRGRRQRDGMISLQLPEVELVFDDDGNVVDAVPEDDSFTHTLIEMFMVEANEAVARLFADLGVPVLRRIHPEPSFGDVEELRRFAASIGFPLPDAPQREDIQRLLDRTRSETSARAIHFAVLRTLTKAEYSPAIIGHFALASSHYAHFTSPIRRYPDLQVHRALEAFLQRTDNGRTPPRDHHAARAMGRAMLEDARCPAEDALVTLGRHCSGTEQNATAAERQLREFLVLSFLAEKHLGEEFDGIVTGVTPNTVFVSIERYLVEGMAKVADLPAGGAERGDGEGGGEGRGEGRGEDRGPDRRGGPPKVRWDAPGGRVRTERWRIDDRTGRLVAGSGASIGMGDQVRVRIEEIDIAARHMTLAIVQISRRMAHRPSGGEGEERRPSAAYRSKQQHERSSKQQAKQRRDREKRKDGRKKGRRQG